MTNTNMKGGANMTQQELLILYILLDKLWDALGDTDIGEALIVQQLQGYVEQMHKKGETL